MPLSITILTEGSLTASVVGQGIVASIVPSQALLEVNVGVPGASATVSVGTTTTGDAGTNASVVNVGTTTAAILDFTIPRGDKGEQGNAGDSATVDAGTTTTLEPGSDATVENVGTTSNAVFNFGIPAGVRGEQGERGYQGEKGDQGDAAVINVGTTSTLSAGSPATVTNSGTEQNAVFNFGIPQGYQGVKGDTGSQGEPGVGVPAGGTFGQGLIKTSNTFDYETAWAGPFLSRVDTGLQGIAGSIQVQGSLDMDDGAIQNVDSIQVNTVNVTYGTSPKIHFGSGDQITPWIEAPSDGSTYGRKDGAWEIVSGGGGGGTWGSITGTLSNQTDLQNALDAKLSLTGGTMSGDITFPVDVNGNDSLVGAFGFGVENLDAGQSASIEPNQIGITTDGVGTFITSAGITGPASGADNAFSLSNASISWKNINVSGAMFDVTNVGLSGKDGGENNYSLTPDSVSGSNSDTGLSWSFGASGATFTDATVQTTAALPLTGGTVTGNVTIDGGNNFTVTGADGNVFSTDYNTNLVKIGLGTTPVEISSDWIKTENNEGYMLFGRNYDGADNLGILFANSTFQNTAWLGYNGTTSQYIRGDGSLYTFPPVGDRYLTSSTSTLTVDSGNGKTMTVGTGLSYSPQQDITVSYNTANHMHGTVLTYNSATGVMTWDSNTHSGSGTYSNWEVNVGGVAGAVLPVGGTASQVLAKINSTNFNTEWISLGTMAQATATDYLAKAGNLSGLSSTATSRTNLGLGAVATDAYATNLQAVQNTSTTTVLSPANSRFAGISTNVWSAGVTGLSSATSGLGANAGSSVTSLNGNLISSNSLVAGYATRGFTLAYPSNSVNNGYNYGTASGHSVRVYSSTWATAVTGVKMRAVFGRMLGSLPTPGTLASRGYGWEWDFSTKVISIIAHNGTSLTTTAQTWTPVSFRTYAITVYSDGAGTISLYIDGTLIGTGTGGPTDTSVTAQVWWQMEIENQATAGSQQTITYSNPKVITTNG